MDVQVAEQGPCRRILKITLAPEDIRAKIDEVYKSAAQQVEIRGFRKGKVPRKVLQQKYGEEIEAQAKERIVRDTFGNAVRDSGLDVVGSPKLENFDGEKDLDPDAPLEFEVHVDIRPEFELGDVTGIEIEGRDSAVTDEDIDNALQEIANQKRTLESVDEPIEDGDFFKVDLIFANESGETVLEKKEGQQLNLAIPIAGTDPQVFADKLRGQEKGATAKIELTFPETFEIEEVRGQSGTVDVTVQEILRVQPAPIDDELAKGFEFESLDALKDTLRERIAQEKESGEKSRREEAVLDKIMDAHPFDLPESLVEQETDHLLQDLARRMKEGGMDDQQIEGRVAEQRPDARNMAERRVRGSFLIDAIAKREKIFVTEGDVGGEIQKIAAANNAPPQAVREYLEQNDQLGMLRLQVRERKVREFLTSKAKISDTTEETAS